MVNVHSKKFYSPKNPLFEDGWSELNLVEKNKTLNKICEDWHNRNPETWRFLTAFLTLDSASDYSFTVPRSTFKDAYSRYVHLLESRVLGNDKRVGLFNLVENKPGRKSIPQVAKDNVIDLMKGMKKVCFAVVD